MPNHILVAFASRAGSTAEIAQAIGEVLFQSGASIDILPVDQVRDLARYDAIILGSATRQGQLLPQALRFATNYREALQAKPVAYFQVGITMREDTPANRQLAASFLQPLIEIATPISIGLFAGKVQHSSIEPPWGWLARLDKHGDLREGDWRNWDSIRDWANEVLSRLP